MRNLPLQTEKAAVEDLLRRVGDLGEPAGQRAEAANRLRRQLEDHFAQEVQLQQRQHAFESLVENAQDVIGRFDSQLRYQYVNPAIIVYTGRPPEEFIGKTHRELGFPGPLCDQWEAKLREVFATRRPLHFEFAFVRPSGHEGWHEARLVPEINPDDGQVQSVICVGRDITEAKQAQKAQREVEERFRLLIDGIKEYALFLLDPEGRVLSWSAGAEWLKGYKAQEVIGEPCAMFYPPEDRAAGKPEEHLAQAARHGRYVTEGWRVRKDGSRFWARTLLTALRHPDGSLRGFAKVTEDVTDRKQAAEAVAGSERQHRAFFELVSVGLAQADWQTGRFQRVNAKLCQITGYGEAELLGMSFADLDHPEDRARSQETFEQFRAGQMDAYELEKRYIRKDGRTIWVNVNVALVRDAQGRPLHKLGVVLDITDRKVFEEQLQQAKERAEAAARAKDQFLAVLSHELRTPLTPVLTAVQLMERDQNLSPQQQASIHMVHRNVVLETRLIDDLLDLTRISRGKLTLHPGPVDVHAILRNTLEICHGDLRSKRLKLAVNLGAPEPAVLGDAARLQQVFWNLLKNAIKFTPEGGSISLHTSQPAPGRLAVSVQDTGVGIAPEMLSRLFNAFEQGSQEVTRLFGGLGLGLAISKGLVELHGGTLAATSPGTGQGATFTVELPTAPVQALARPEPPEGSGTARPRGGRILLVEDHRDTAAVMAKLLRTYGYDVRVATSIAAAQRAAEAESFDLLVSDIGLPDGSGLDLMRQLSSQRMIKGIALSGFGMEEDLRKSKEAGFAEHLTKPVDMDQLAQVLERVLAGS